MHCPVGFAAPDFLIIGTQKGGTSSLYDYLCSHPQVLGVAQKEIHYFDNNFDRPESWYLNQFPSVARRLLRRLRRGGSRAITGEATPMYLVHPHVPERIAKLAPDVKLIVLLRDPAERAYSQYQHNRREGWEPMSFEEAIDAEEDRIRPVLQAMERDPLLVDTRFHAYSYKARGHYLEQLLRYERLFPAEQMLVLCSEELFANPAAVYRRVLDFLGLEPFEPAEFKISNAGSGAALPERVGELRRYFAPLNRDLFDHVGRKMAWA